ncbi:hypothetical protein [Streptomyces chartreusis]
MDDIRQRRHGVPGAATEQRITRRAELTLAFLRSAIEQAIL